MRESDRALEREEEAERERKREKEREPLRLQPDQRDDHGGT